MTPARSRLAIARVWTSASNARQPPRETWILDVPPSPGSTAESPSACCVDRSSAHGALHLRPANRLAGQFHSLRPFVPGRGLEHSPDKETRHDTRLICDAIV